MKISKMELVSAQLHGKQPKQHHLLKVVKQKNVLFVEFCKFSHFQRHNFQKKRHLYYTNRQTYADSILTFLFHSIHLQMPPSLMFAKLKTGAQNRQFLIILLFFYSLCVLTSGKMVQMTSRLLKRQLLIRFISKNGCHITYFALLVFLQRVFVWKRLAIFSSNLPLEQAVRAKYFMQ